jgi:hypothetical protein
VNYVAFHKNGFFATQKIFAFFENGFLPELKKLPVTSKSWGGGVGVVFYEENIDQTT